MAIINNNVQNVKFLRNGALYGTHEAAYEALTGFTLTTEQDGTIILARYGSGANVKTLAGLVYADATYKSITVIDIEGASGDVEALRTEINNKLGTGITSANTATAQLAALSGGTFTPGESSSADTSVEGAKEYAYDLIGTLDYSGVTTGDGVYVTNVIQGDGVVSASTAVLPSVTGEVESKKVVMSVSEDKGEISVDKGTIESSDNTVVINDVEDGGNVTGIDFKVNIDNDTLIADTGTGVISVASAALTQYVGDEDTIHISTADANNNKTVSSYLTIQKVTTGLSEEVKEEYHLIGHSGTTIGDPVKIYKDSHIVSITYITDTGDTHYQNLEYVYLDASGNTNTEYVDISMLVLEAEFASGLTIENHVARGVVDSNSEKDSNNDPFLTVGADGFKIDGIKDEIAAQLGDVVEGLDATVTGATSGNHVTISIEELDGKLVQSGLTIEENDIASASDLAELSGKTVTAITSINGSITANIDDAVGCKTYDLATDASKIKMSGFTSQGIFSGITSSSSITEAFGEVEDIIEENERITSEALNDLDGRLDDIESGYVETVKVNNVPLAETDNVVNIQIESASGATASNANNAIIVDTDANGKITLGLNFIDCGTY